MKDLQSKTDTQNLTKTEPSASEFKNIYYIMHYEIPSRYYVSNIVDPTEFRVSDISGTVTIYVKFDIDNPSARYVFYLDGEGPEKMDSDAQVVLRICHVVNQKLLQWIGDSRRRRCKVMMKASVNRVMQHHDCSIPMAFLSPDRPDQTQSPEEIRKQRVQFRRELDKNIRTVGFGYHQIRGAYINRDMEADDQVFYILYGKADKKSEQLLKIIATELGKKYSQETVGFCDLSGRTSVIFTMPCGSHSGDGEPGYHTADITVSGEYAPIERFAGAQISLRRKHAFERYCNECWDEESQTYHFDHRYHNYF